jgi:phosphoribosylglycinamide formyltransferase 1
MTFIVLSSSRGTTFQAVIDRLQDGSLKATCLGLIADKPDRGCVTKAKTAGIPVRVADTEHLSSAITELGGDAETVIALMGWMWILPETFVRAHTVINVHPALLPKHGGEGMYGRHVHEAVLKAGDKESGITIHRVDAGVDTGEILLQKTCPVLPDDTAETLQARVQELEKEWYPKFLDQI